MKPKRILQRLVSALLILCLVLPVHADTIEEVEAQREALKKENANLQEQMDALREDESKALEYQTALQEKITVTEGKIDNARATIALMDEEITLLESRLKVAEEEYKDTLDLFKQRLRALYKSGTSEISTLEVLLNSTSLADFTARVQLIEAMYKQDQELMDKVQEYMDKTRADREAVSAARALVARTKKELEADQKELEALNAENDALLAELRTQQKETENQIAANEEEDAELEAHLQELIEERNRQEEERRKQAAAQASGGSIPPVSPGMHDDFHPCWPLPGIGLGNITGHFGTTGSVWGSSAHGGMDIGAPYGTPIIATQAGQVLSAEFHWSWGNNVLIWHNGNFSTRYAHCSSLAVSPGQYVEQGQVIGYVGATGNAYGYHLHYEVYYNGSRVAPEPYLGLW